MVFVSFDDYFRRWLRESQGIDVSYAWGKFDNDSFSRMSDDNYVINTILSDNGFSITSDNISNFLSLIDYRNKHDEDFIGSLLRESFDDDSFGRLSFYSFIESMYYFILYNFTVEKSEYYSRSSLYKIVREYSVEINESFSSLTFHGSFYTRFIFNLCFNKSLGFDTYEKKVLFDTKSSVNPYYFFNNYLRDYDILFHDMIDYSIGGTNLFNNDNNGFSSIVFWDNIHHYIARPINNDYFLSIDNSLYNLGEYVNNNYEYYDHLVIKDRLSFAILVCLSAYHYSSDSHNIDVDYLMWLAFSCSHDRIVNISVDNFVRDIFSIEPGNNNEKMLFNIALGMLK